MLAQILCNLVVLQALNASAAEARRPNILFIYTDDHSYRTLSCYEGAEPCAHAQHGSPGGAWGPLHPCVYRHVVHAVASDHAHRLAAIRRAVARTSGDFHPRKDQHIQS